MSTFDTILIIKVTQSCDYFHNFVFLIKLWQVLFRLMADLGYVVNRSSTGMEFRFESIGVNGVKQKIIQYQSTEYYNTVNLAFGDIGDNGELDDKVRSSNGDHEKVLITVASTSLIFTEKYPDCFIIVSGSCHLRTRLYQMSILKYYDEISKDFIIWGYIPGSTEFSLFEKGYNYEKFLFKRKQ